MFSLYVYVYVSIYLEYQVLERQSKSACSLCRRHVVGNLGLSVLVVAGLAIPCLVGPIEARRVMTRH